MTAALLDGVEENRSEPGAYRRSVVLRLTLIALLFTVALGAALADLLVGSGTLALSEVLSTLISPGTAEPAASFILWDLRLPMTIMALVAGASLALSGLLMQTVLDNPLAEPFTLGVSSAAGFGAALALGLGLSITILVPGLPPELGTAGNAFLFALLTCALVLALTRGAASVQSITLLGIALHFVFSSLLSLVQYLAAVDQLQSIVFWLMGSLQRATWLKVSICASVMALTLPVVLLQAWGLTALRSFGSEAVVLGIHIQRLRIVMLSIAALLAGAVTSVVGIVGFIGLVSPHVARLLVGEDHRFSIPATVATGMAFAALASLASKTLIPGAVLPLGMVTSLTGLPFFVFLVMRRIRAERVR